ncbi:hypothetical protein [Streptomyces nigrescens]
MWDDPEFGRLFRWNRAWQGFAVAKRPAVLNLELDLSTGHGSFLEVTGWAFDGHRALGTGRAHTATAMRSWMRYDIPLAGNLTVA